MFNATAGERASLSVAVTLALDCASRAVAVLTSGSTTSAASNATGTVTVSVLAAPAGTIAWASEALASPAVPVTVTQLAVPAATHVTGPRRRTPAGSGSSSVTSSASDSPVVASVGRYSAAAPGVYVALASVLASVSGGMTCSTSLSDAVWATGSSGSAAGALFTSGLAVMLAANATGSVSVTVLAAPAAMVAPLR